MVLIFLPQPGFTAAPTIFVPSSTLPTASVWASSSTWFTIMPDPTGNYLKEFSPDYFTDRYSTDWGEAFNFDGPNSGPVREFFISNAGYWIDEFHLDGLRLDATQNIYDASKVHILAEITESGAPSRRRSLYHRSGGKRTPGRATDPSPLKAAAYGMDATVER